MSCRSGNRQSSSARSGHLNVFSKDQLYYRSSWNRHLDSNNVVDFKTFYYIRINSENRWMDYVKNPRMQGVIGGKISSKILDTCLQKCLWRSQNYGFKSNCMFSVTAVVCANGSLGNITLVISFKLIVPLSERWLDEFMSVLELACNCCFTL